MRSFHSTNYDKFSYDRGCYLSMNRSMNYLKPFTGELRTARTSSIKRIRSVHGEICNENHHASSFCRIWNSLGTFCNWGYNVWNSLNSGARTPIAKSLCYFLFLFPKNFWVIFPENRKQKEFTQIEQKPEIPPTPVWYADFRGEKSGNCPNRREDIVSCVFIPSLEFLRVLQLVSYDMTASIWIRGMLWRGMA